MYVGKGERDIPSGIARRLLAHVIKPVARGGPYVFQKKWKERGVTAIHTLGVEPDRQYLIPALESYLIVAFRPVFNLRR